MSQNSDLSWWVYTTQYWEYIRERFAPILSDADYRNIDEMIKDCRWLRLLDREAVPDAFDLFADRIDRRIKNWDDAHIEAAIIADGE